MDWEEVRRIHPNTYAKVRILKSHMEGDIQEADDVDLIYTISDPHEATRDLVRNRDGTVVVYHTDSERLEILIDKSGFRHGFRLSH